MRVTRTEEEEVLIAAEAAAAAAAAGAAAATPRLIRLRLVLMLTLPPTRMLALMLVPILTGVRDSRRRR